MGYAKINNFKSIYAVFRFMFYFEIYLSSYFEHAKNGVLY